MVELFIYLSVVADNNLYREAARRNFYKVEKQYEPSVQNTLSSTTTIRFNAIEISFDKQNNNNNDMPPMLPPPYRANTATIITEQ